MKKSVYYDVDISSDGSQQDYIEGNEISWDRQMTYDTREEADEAVKHFLGEVSSIRIVRVIDPENTPEIRDVFTWFKYSLNEKKVNEEHRQVLSNFFSKLG